MGIDAKEFNKPWIDVETMLYVLYTAHSYLFHNLPECIVQPYIGSQC